MGLMVKEAELAAKSDADADRRIHDRFEVTWAVDCVADDTFLFASLTNISEMGIFVQTNDPLVIGTSLWMSFTPPAAAGSRDVASTFKLEGVVAWVNPLKADGDNINPGMGVRFVSLTAEDRERIVAAIRSIAYLR